MSDSKNVFSKVLDAAKVQNENAYEWLAVERLSRRRMYLYGVIESVDNSDLISPDLLSVRDVAQAIFEFNREDAGKPVEEREPIIIYVNSPGGSPSEGFTLISTIELSKTPVYTVNVGEWCSMAFLIGVSGHKRFSLPNMTFLMHDGSNFVYGSNSKVQDAVDFSKRFESEVIKKHVLKHSKMSSEEYDKFLRVELYMLPEDAMKYGFIDKIVEDIDEIL